MRTETELKGKEVLAIWIKGCVPYVSEDYSRLTNAVRQSKLGRNGEKRDFLKTSAKETYITQGSNNIRRSCTVIFLDELPGELSVKLKEGMQCIASYIVYPHDYQTFLEIFIVTYMHANVQFTLHAKNQVHVQTMSSNSVKLSVK